MYSAYPIQDANLYHTGFYFIVFILILFYAGLVLIKYLESDDIEWSDHVGYWLICSIILWLSYYGSYVRQVPVPENIKTAATFIQFVPEVNRAGKSVAHQTYCQYEIDSDKNNVLIPCTSSPSRVYLYWNSK